MKCTLLTKLVPAVLALALLSACQKPEKDNPTPTPENPVKLKTPEPVVRSQSSTGFVISWEEIENASSYIVFFKDAEETVETPQFEAKNLTIGTYTVNVKAVSGSKEYTDSDWSEPIAVEVKTETGSENELIELLECGRYSFTFRIKGGDNYYRFEPVEKIAYEMYGGSSPEAYLAQFGIRGYGDRDYEWVDGDVYDGYYEISVAPDREYIIFAAICDAEYNITGPVSRIDFRTEANPVSDKKIDIKLSEITSTSVRITAKPDAAISEYYIYARDKAWYDDIITNYGESMLITLIKYPSANAKHYYAESSEVWEGFKPSSEYIVGAVGVEGSTGAEVLIMEPFTTSASSGTEPKLDISIETAADKPHENVKLTVKSDIAYLIRYAFMPTADVQYMYLSKGKTYDDIISAVGTDLTVEEVAMANAGGFSVQIEALWPETEYTCIVSTRSNEWVTVTRHTTITMAAEPVLPRVESDLFDVLPGKWLLSYDAIKSNGDPYRVENVEVEIAVSPDAASADKYRGQNKLVVLGYQFFNDYATNPIPYYSPEDLMEVSGYWKDYKSLAYRDYGPKFCLQIAQDGTVSVPTSLNAPLYDWDVSTVMFVGVDWGNKWTAPAAFPVEISADRKTITIKECKAGPEFNNGTYRPGVFMNGVTSMLNAASSDIVLKRVESGNSAALSSKSSGPVRYRPELKGGPSVFLPVGF